MTDFVVIGGGVHGAACAWELARRGAGVRLLEARTLASAASGGPGRRGVRANMRDQRELPLMVRAHERWPTLHEELGCDEPLFERTGNLTLIERDQDLEAAPARLWLQQRAGLECALLERDELLAREPAVGGGVRAAIECPLDGVSPHAETTRRFAAAARRAGAVIDEHRPVARLETNGATVRAVITADGERIAVEHGCLLLANAAAPALLESTFALQLPVWSTALQVLVVEPREPFHVAHLIGHMSRTLAIKSEGDGQTMVSGGYRGRWHAAEHRGEPLEQAIADNLAQAVAVFPALEGARVVQADTGHLEAMCIDGVPVIDRPDPDSNLLYATGWCGHGWAIAPAVAPLLAEWALEGGRPEVLAPFGFSRFDVSS